MKAAIFLTLACLGVASAAHARFEHVVITDSLTGEGTKIVWSKSESGASILIKQVSVGPELTDNTLIGLTPVDTHICDGPKGMVWVSWVVVKEDGEITKPATEEWGVSTNNRIITLSTNVELFRSRANRVINGMKSAQEIRFRFKDSCGEQETMIFPLAGYQEAVQQLLTP